MSNHPKAPNCAETLIGLEATAARIEGTFAADPDLAMLWRGPAMLTEACRSVALEDIHVLEGDVLRRAWQNRNTDMETARGAEAVLAMLPVIAAPPDLFGDVEAGLARILRAATVTERPVDVGIAGQGGRAVLSERLADIAVRVTAEMAGSTSPILGALRVTLAFRVSAECPIPSAERLLFMTTEHALRRLEETRRDGAGSPDPVVPHLRARWICLPSAALTQGRFRAWSPGTPAGVRDLLEGMQADLDRTLGALPVLRRWRDGARAYVDGRHGRSRIGDLLRLAIREPVLTTARVRDALGVSPRAAQTLVVEAMEQGMLVSLVGRQTYRVFGTPMMADRLRLRRSPRPAVSVAARASPSAPDAPPQIEVDNDAEDQATREQRILDDLDAAMAQADAVLSRYSDR